MNYLLMLRTLIEIVKLVESLLPEPGQGQTKLSMVKGFMSAVVQDGGMALDTFEANWPKFQSVISLIVDVYNQTGAFKKGIPNG
jgi:hypothetical protein